LNVYKSALKLDV